LFIRFLRSVSLAFWKEPPLKAPKIDSIVYIVKVKFCTELLKHMDSLTLKQNGFVEFLPLKGLPFSSLPLNKGSVLVLADGTLTGKPTSDILYIGKSKKLTRRIFGGYLAGYGGKTTRKISSKLLDDGYIEKVSVSWMLTDDPKATQQELLGSFKKEHGEYPAWNALKKTSVNSQQSAAKAAKSRPARKPAKPAPSKR